MCKNAIDTQEHALRCHVIKDNLTAEDRSVLANIQYSNIFSDTEKHHKLLTYNSKFKPTTGKNSEPSR